MPLFTLEELETFPDYWLQSCTPKPPQRLNEAFSVRDWFYYTNPPIELSEEEVKRWGELISARREMEALLEQRLAEAQQRKDVFIILLRLWLRLNQ